MAFSDKQLGLLNQVREMENPKVRKELLAVIAKMEASRDAHLEYAAQQRRFNEILGEEDVEDEAVDLIVGNGIVVRLQPQDRPKRKASPAGRSIRKIVHRPLEASERA